MQRFVTCGIYEGTNNLEIFDKNQWVLPILHIYFTGLINQNNSGMFSVLSDHQNYFFNIFIGV